MGLLLHITCFYLRGNPALDLRNINIFEVNLTPQNKKSSMTHIASAPLDQVILYLQSLTGVGFKLSKNRDFLEFTGSLEISAYDRIFDLCSKGVITATISQAIGAQSRHQQHVEIESLDPERLRELVDREPIRVEQGKAAAQILTRLTNKVWAFDDRCLFTASPAEGDPLYAQLEKMQEVGALHGSPPYNKLQYETGDGVRHEYISIADFDVSRLRVMNPSQSQTAINL